MNQQHIKNHYVPECYLKRWANTNNRVYVYRTLVSHLNVPIWKLHSISAIGYQKHLYTHMISGLESDEFERWLDKEFEAPASRIIDKAVSDRRLNRDDWAILIRFLAAQDVRTPARLYEHLIRARKTMQEILNSILSDLEEKLTVSDLEAIKNGYASQDAELFPLKVSTHIEEGSDTGILKAETYVGRSTWLYSIKHVLEKTITILHKHKWTILKPTKGYNWFTSDNPVVKLNYYGPNKYDLKGCWGKQRGNIFFPIGPDHAMFVQIGDRPPLKGHRLALDQTLQFRKFSVENAYRMIFSEQIDGAIERLRPRIIDRDSFLRERSELGNWHKANLELEKKYIKSNRTA